MNKKKTDGLTGGLFFQVRVVLHNVFYGTQQS